MKFIVGMLVAICGNCFTFISVYAADSASPVTRNKPSNSATPRKAPSVSNIGIALSDSFDTSQTNLPQRFEGHDVEALFKKVYLRRNEYKKDQFETKQAFKERTDKLSEELAPSSIAFGVKVPASYDAEKGRFSIGAPLLYQVMRESFESTFALDIRETDAPSRTYVGENAFGRKANVTEASTTRWAVGLDMTHLQKENAAFRVRRSGRDDGLFGYAELELSMAPSDARAVKGDLAFLLIGSLSYPFANTSLREKGATISNPLAIKFDYRIVNLALKELWLYNFSKGQVYSRLKLPVTP